MILTFPCVPSRVNSPTTRRHPTRRRATHTPHIMRKTCQEEQLTCVSPHIRPGITPRITSEATHAMQYDAEIIGSNTHALPRPQTQQQPMYIEQGCDAMVAKSDILTDCVESQVHSPTTRRHHTRQRTTRTRHIMSKVSGRTADVCPITYDLASRLESQAKPHTRRRTTRKSSDQRPALPPPTQQATIY